MKLAATAALVLAAVLAPAAGAASPPPLADRCYDPPLLAAPFWLTTADGVRLYAVEAGEGTAAVVLVHESGSGLCGALPYAATLARAGIRVLAFDLRTFGESDSPDTAPLAFDRDLAAAVARLRGEGARSVFLAGASLGGAAVLTYGSKLDVDGIVSFSGEALLRGYRLNAAVAVRRLRAPLLIVGTRHDRYLSIPDALTLLRLAGSTDKRTAFYPGGFHGWSIVDTAPYASKARALVLAWLRKHAAASGG